MVGRGLGVQAHAGDLPDGSGVEVNPCTNGDTNAMAAFLIGAGRYLTLKPFFFGTRVHSASPPFLVCLCSLRASNLQESTRTIIARQLGPANRLGRRWLTRGLTGCQNMIAHLVNPCQTVRNQWMGHGGGNFRPGRLSHLIPS